MKTFKKTAGFSLIELLVVIAIIGILAVALVPSFFTYIMRAKFQDVINVAQGYKNAVAYCIMKNGKLAGCSSNSADGTVPDVSKFAATANVATVTIVDGVIKVTSTATLPGPTTGTYYQLTPNFTDLNSPIIWSNSGSGCLTSVPQLCDLNNS